MGCKKGMQSRRLDRVPRETARFTEMAMSAISRGRIVGRQRENPITAYIRGTGARLRLGERLTLRADPY